MKIGITGAAGGIGSILADQLLENDFELVLIDNLSSGLKSNFLHQENRSKLLKADILDERKMHLALRDCEVIIHLAAVSSLAACQINPKDAFMINLTGTSIISKIANDQGSLLIFASTSAVYENSLSSPFTENETPPPTLIYPSTKRFAELLLESLNESNGLNYLTLRFFNVFGWRQDVKRSNPPLVNYLVREHMMGRVAKLYAPPNQRRDYVCADDVSDIILKILKEKSNLPNTSLNVCRGVGISIQEIISSLETGFGEKINFIQGNPSDLWENYTELFQSSNPLKLEIVKKETLKNSIGSPKKSEKLLNWTAKRDVLKAIQEELPAMQAHVQKTLRIK